MDCAASVQGRLCLPAQQRGRSGIEEFAEGWPQDLDELDEQRQGEIGVEADEHRHQPVLAHPIGVDVVDDHAPEHGGDSMIAMALSG